MTDLALSGREADLLHAALSADRATATKAWESWNGSVVLEDAPHAELRLLPTVHANLSRIAPDFSLPAKLRGKARATFTFNRLIGHESLPVLRALAGALPVMVTKGHAFCAQFNAAAFRQTGDVDIQVRYRNLRQAIDIFTGLGWTPKYGLTARSLKFRTPLRRNSWNLTKGKGDIDLHWRLLDCDRAGRLAERFWGSAVRRGFLGLDVMMPSPEFSIVGSLHHGFREGTRADMLQALVDCWHWLPLCDRTRLADALALSGTRDLLQHLKTAFEAAKLPPGERGPGLREATLPQREPVRAKQRIRSDKFVLRHRRMYRMWEQLGRGPLLERLMLRYFGPISKPLSPSADPRAEYDLRCCAVIDEIGGPGWGWPEPEHTCFWSDQADNRLLLPLPAMRDYLAIFSVSGAARTSPKPDVWVFVNGRRSQKLKLRSTSQTAFPILVPRAHLFGPWVEFSFRPNDFDTGPSTRYWERRSLPAVGLRIMTMEKVAADLLPRAVGQALPVDGGLTPRTL